MERDANFRIMLEHLTKRKYLVANKPVQIILGLTSACNLHCSFCAYCGFCCEKELTADTMPLEFLKKLAPYFRCAKLLNPSGRGEPFLYKEFGEFIEICRENDALKIMHLTNNGTQLGRWDLSVLDGVNIIAVSIDSVDKKTFEILRYGGSLELVLENVRKLRRTLPHTVLQWSVVVTRLNIMQLADIYKAAREYGINYISYNDVYGYEDDKVIQLLRLRESDRAIVESQFDEIQRLNEDSKLVVNNLITWSGYEDGKILPSYDEIYATLEELKEIEPYLSFDRLNCVSDSSRRIKTECRGQHHVSENRMPYCTSPFAVMLIQPDLSVSPCCASYGTIDKAEDSMEAVWNGESFQNLREAMFDYDMLPDYCKQCRAFVRYDYINEYIEMLKQSGRFDIQKLVIPPDYDPPEGYIRDENVMKKIKLAQSGFFNMDGSQKYELNSRKYWEHRFETDWLACNGSEQTRYFASLVSQLLPEWLVHEINQNGDTVCDLGCAMGDALPVYKETFLTSGLCGEDFSERAIAGARQRYPGFSFRVSDLTCPDGEAVYPVVICSNVLEHFGDTYQTIAGICQRAAKYTILLLPYREEPGIILEYERSIHTKDIPLAVGENCLVYAKSVKCDSEYYPYEQILLVYAKGGCFALLSDIVDNVSSDKEKIQGLRLTELNEKSVVQEKELAKCQDKIACLQEELAQQKKETEYLQGSLAEQKSHIDQYTMILKKHRQQVEELRREREQIDQQRKQDVSDLYAVIEQKDRYFVQTQELCTIFAAGKLMRLNHFITRIYNQFLKGGKKGRKEFCTWLAGKMRGSNKDVGAGVIYNPWQVVGNTVQAALSCRADTRLAAEACLADGREWTGQPDTVVSAFSQKYTKYDVIILSVIDFHFRYQRPQHFADCFAADGHRVFYVNSGFATQDHVEEEKAGLYVVSLSCSGHSTIYSIAGKKEMAWMKEKLVWLVDSYAIRDAILIVDYPNWVYGAEYIREQYGFKIVTDYMDDYTGFIQTAEDFLRDNCVRLLKTSDLIIASSQYLYDAASGYGKEGRVRLIRNGTQTDHFAQAAGVTHTEKKRKVIGYYGAVAHWFAWNIVCYLAEQFPECDIAIVGEVTAHGDKLGKYTNIQLHGEVCYEKLPEYLADFDVCLIPFDTSTDLIKATNPVKFYEYLSAGKKIVATEIPELMPYQGKYAYLANDRAKFAEYVRLCLDGTDTLESREACISFARQNDWAVRYQDFDKACICSVPKITVIVLTYNDRDMNQACIESILNKTAYANYQLIVVDNHSLDDTVEYLNAFAQEGMPNVKVLLQKENRGFAGGNNCGLRIADGDYVILLNNDTLVTRGWMTNLAKHLENNSHYAMCNPVTNSIGNESKILVDYKNKRELDRFSYFYTTSHMGKEYTEADRIPLFATIIRKSVLDEIGTLDEEYRIGMFEDDDYTKRVLQAGYGFVIAEDAFVHHRNNTSFKRLGDEQYQKVFDENRRIFESKWKQEWKPAKYREGVTGDANDGLFF